MSMISIREQWEPTRLIHYGHDSIRGTATEGTPVAGLRSPDARLATMLLLAVSKFHPAACVQARVQRACATLARTMCRKASRKIEALGRCAAS